VLMIQIGATCSLTHENSFNESSVIALYAFQWVRVAGAEGRRRDRILCLAAYFAA
jgi:hypothetical protein